MPPNDEARRALTEAIKRQIVLLRFEEADTLDFLMTQPDIDMLAARAADAALNHFAALRAPSPERGDAGAEAMVAELVRERQAALNCRARSIDARRDFFAAYHGGRAEAYQHAKRIVEALPLATPAPDQVQGEESRS